MKVKKPTSERLSILIDSGLKRALRKQAKRAGLSLSEWVRTRLWLDGTDPAEMAALLKELERVTKRIERCNAKFDALRAEWDASDREAPARLAEAKRQGRLWAEQLLARKHSALRGCSPVQAWLKTIGDRPRLQPCSDAC